MIVYVNTLVLALQCQTLSKKMSLDRPSGCVRRAVSPSVTSLGMQHLLPVDLLRELSRRECCPKVPQTVYCVQRIHVASDCNPLVEEIDGGSLHAPQAKKRFLNHGFTSCAAHWHLQIEGAHHVHGHTHLGIVWAVGKVSTLHRHSFALTHSQG